MKLSVVICSYNPDKDIFSKVIGSLKTQTLRQSEWELIVIDNNSSIPIKDSLTLDWHFQAKILIESRPGLFFARLLGVKESSSSLIVFVDDDNILDDNYLTEALKFHQSNRHVGCFGGKSIPIFEVPPAKWFYSCNISLGCQDYGGNIHISNYKSRDFEIKKYPDKAPIGTGMVILKQAFIKYAHIASDNSERSKLGRKGNSLVSGEDNDIILSTIKNGYEIAYIPTLIIKHVIPASRLTSQYLSKMSYESNRSWVKVLHLHQILPWKPIDKLTYPFRCIKSFFLNKAFLSELNYIKWMGTCGTFKGLSEI